MLFCRYYFLSRESIVNKRPKSLHFFKVSAAGTSLPNLFSACLSPPQIQSLVLSVLDTLKHLFFSGFIAFQFIGDDHPWGKALFFEQFAEKSLCCLGIPMPLHQNIQHIPLRIHCSPQVILLSFDRDNHLIKMPFVCNVRAFTPQLIRILQISGTIRESIRRSPQSHGTASFSRVSR